MKLRSGARYSSTTSTRSEKRIRVDEIATKSICIKRKSKSKKEIVQRKRSIDFDDLMSVSEENIDDKIEKETDENSADDTLVNEELFANVAPLPLDKSFDEEEEQREERERILLQRVRKRSKMSDYLNRIEKLRMTGNLSENWRRFKRHFDIFLAAGKLNVENDEVKINTLLNAVGEEAIDVFDTFGLTEAQQKSYDEVVKAFETFCKAKKNTVYERYVFYERNQKDGEPFDTFLMEIKRLARNCEFDNETEMLRDRIVMGIHDKSAQRKMLEMSDLTYDKAVQMARQAETTKEQVNVMSGTKTADVHEIRRNTQHRNSNGHVDDDRSNNNNNGQRHNRNSNNSKAKKAHTQHRSNDTRANNSSQNKGNNENRSGKNSLCKFCNYSHQFGTKFCPAYGKKCTACSRNNHFASVCRTKNVSAISFDDFSDYDFDDNNEFCVNTLSKEKSETDDAYSFPWIERIEIDDSSVPHKIDTGAGVDVLPMSVLKRIAPHAEIKRTSMTLRAFAGEKIKPIGTCVLTCTFHKMTLMVKFAIVDFDCTPILGLRTCIRFKIVQPSRTRVFRNKNQTDL